MPNPFKTLFAAYALVLATAVFAEPSRVLAQPSSMAPRTCGTVLGDRGIQGNDLDPDDKVPVEVGDFNEALFETFKAKFLTKFRASGETAWDRSVVDRDINTDLQFAALLEAYGEFKGEDFTSWLSRGVQDSTASSGKRATNHKAREAASKRFLRLSRALTFEANPFGPYEFAKLLEDLYEVSNPVPSKWQRYFKPNIARIRKQREKVAEASAELIPLLQKIGVIRNESTLSQLRQIKNETKDLTKLTAAAVANYYTILHFGFPVYVPGLDFQHSGFRKPKWAEAAIPYVDAISRFSQRSLFMGMSAAILLHQAILSPNFTVANAERFIINSPQEIHEVYLGARHDVQNIGSAVQATLNPEGAHIPLAELAEIMKSPFYQDWKAQFQAEHGRAPNVIENSIDQASMMRSLTIFSCHSNPQMSGCSG